MRREHQGYGNASSIHRNPHHHLAAQLPARSLSTSPLGCPVAHSNGFYITTWPPRSHSNAFYITTWLPSCPLERVLYHHSAAQSPIRTRSGALPARSGACPIAIDITTFLCRRCSHHKKMWLSRWQYAALRTCRTAQGELRNGYELLVDSPQSPGKQNEARLESSENLGQ